MKKQWIAAALAVLCLSGCAGSEKNGEQKRVLPLGAAENEILTLKPVAQDKQMVTVHYEYGLDNVYQIEKAIEEQFPDVDLVMVHDGASNSGALLKENLENGTECDLIFARSIPEKGDVAQNFLLDMSGENFINNFYLTSLDACLQSDGGVYYLPGPANLYGIIYDKTVMAENGWKVPTNYSEFVELIHTIDSAGLTVTEKLDGECKEVPVRAIRPSLKYADAFRSLFYPFAYQEVFHGRENLEWLTAYQRGNGSMVGHMEPFAEMMQRLFADGVIRLEDWDYLPRYRLPMLCTSHSTVMIFGPLNTFTNEELVGSDHEFAFLPIFADDEPDSDYLYSIPNYFMAINRASAEAGPERKQLLLDIMAFICDPTAQGKLFGQSNTLISNIKGVLPGESDFNAAIRDTIREGRIITDFYTHSEAALSGFARDMLSDSISVEEYLKKCDESRDAWLDGSLFTLSEPLGICRETMTRLETALTLGQVYRDTTGADIALVYVNTSDQGANCRIFAGEVTDITVGNIAPDRTSPEGAGLAVGTLTGQQILDCLNGVHGTNGNSDYWYFVASGLQVEFAPWMPAGERLVSCKLPDGTALDPEGAYKVAYMSDKLFEFQEDGFAALHPADQVILEGKFSDHFAQWMKSRGGVLERPAQTTVLNWKTKE